MSDSPPPRAVLVTGSAKRLGREVALALASAGWNVAVHYRDSSADAQQTVDDCRKLAAAGAIIESFQADLGDEAQTRALLPRVIERFGGVDALVNNASQFDHDSIKSFSYECLMAHARTNTGDTSNRTDVFADRVNGDALAADAARSTIASQKPEALPPWTAEAQRRVSEHLSAVRAQRVAKWQAWRETGPEP